MNNEHSSRERERENKYLEHKKLVNNEHMYK